MLCRQDLGRRHHGSLQTVLRRKVGGSCRHHRFAGAYIALQKTVHRPVGRKIRQHLADGSLLSAGQSEGEQAVKAVHRNGLHRNGGFFSGGPAGLPQRQIKIE